MISEDEILATTFHPKTPGPRRPLHKMMDESIQKGDQQSNTKTRRPVEESNYESVDDQYADHSYSDEDSSADDADSDENVYNAVGPFSSPENVRSRRLSTPPKIPKPFNSSQKKTLTAEGGEYRTHSPKISDKQRESFSEENTEKIKSKFGLMVAFLIIIVAIITYVAATTESPNAMNNVTKTLLWDDVVIKNFEASIEDMSYKFKKQHSDIWDEIYAGVVDIIRHPAKRSVIFLFSNYDDPMYCLAKMLGNATKAVLQTDDNLWLAPSDFVDDYGEVIAKFEESIKKQRIVIVENILGINPEAMRAFHNFCDSENPLVKQSIYIITMIVKGSRGNEKPHVFVEEQLKRKLEGKINPDKLQPLITRLTDAAIIPVQPEPDITSCPLRY